jgi:4-hydroxybenzoate polyprenyltransferase
VEFLKPASIFFRLVRWPNLLIVTLLQLLAAICLHESVSDIIPVYYYADKLVLLILATIFIAAAGNIINDIQDVKIDSINKPGKQIIETHISRKNALLLYGLFTFAGLVLASFVDFRLFIWNLVAAQILWLYSAVLKCKPLIGNLAVAFLMALAVWVVVYSGNFFNIPLLWFYMAFAFLTGFIRELIKDVEDKKGDAENGCNTFAVKNSLQTVKRSIFSLLLICVLLLTGSGILFIQKQYLYLGLYQLVVMLPSFLYFIRLMQKANEAKQFSRLSLYIKLIMLAGILSMPLANVEV